MRCPEQPSAGRSPLGLRRPDAPMAHLGHSTCNLASRPIDYIKHGESYVMIILHAKVRIRNEHGIGSPVLTGSMCVPRESEDGYVGERRFEDVLGYVNL